MRSSARLIQKATYGPLSRQTLEMVLKRELLQNFGFDQMGAIADLLIARFLALIAQHAPPAQRLRPFEALVLAVSTEERFGYGKRIEMCELVPVRLQLISPQELDELAQGTPLHELRPRMAARILHEAYEQGGVLSYNCLGLLTGLRSVSSTGRLLDKYRELHPEDVLPHSGTIFDLGPTLTHKQQAVILEAQGLLEQEIARRINHHPSAVARYLTDNARVLELWQEGKDVEMITFLTGISRHVVEQYIALHQTPTVPPFGEEEVTPPDA